MEIRMKTLMVGPHVARQPGETCVVTAEEGEMLVRGGYAEAIAKLAENVSKAPAAPEPTAPAPAPPAPEPSAPAPAPPAPEPSAPAAAPETDKVAAETGESPVSPETDNALDEGGRKKGGKR